MPLWFHMGDIPVLIENLVLGGGNEAVMLQGAGLDVLSAAMGAMKWTWAMGFRYVFAAAAGFSGVSLVACWWVWDGSGEMTSVVAVRLENEREQKMVVAIL